MEKRHFNRIEKINFLGTYTSLDVIDTYNLAEILDQYTFAQILEIAKVIRTIGHGKDLQ